MHPPQSRPIKMWVGFKPDPFHGNPLFQDRGIPDIEDSAVEQLRNIARLPFIHRNGVAAMPDVHMGVGAAVGTVIATQKAIIPSAVGVDIGCGMVAVRTSLKATDLPDSLREIRHSIERGVPLGAGGEKKHASSDFEFYMRRLSADFPTPMIDCGGDYERLTEKAVKQLGTLGSGNHFIELCLDEAQAVWVTLHSGSRGIGNRIGRQFIEIAKREMERYFVTLPDADLAYLPEGTEGFANYVAAVSWAQDYAKLNRSVMLQEVLRNLHHHIKTPFTVTDEAINCHHNYIERENHFGDNLWITRKGAIRARDGDLGIIPGSMGQRSFIVRGKGHAESYHSCSHGAGRIMSRTQARKQFTVDDLQAQTLGVECRKDSSVLDEIPSSYKNIDAVMALQTDLVDIVHTLKQVMCVKGG